MVTVHADGLIYCPTLRTPWLIEVPMSEETCLTSLDHTAADSLHGISSLEPSVKNFRPQQGLSPKDIKQIRNLSYNLSKRGLRVAVNGSFALGVL